MYRVVRVERHFYPHVVLELQDTTDTQEMKYWCYADFCDDDLCQSMGEKDLTGCILDTTPEHGCWIAKEDIHLL